MCNDSFYFVMLIFSKINIVIRLLFPPCNGHKASTGSSFGWATAEAAGMGLASSGKFAMSVGDKDRQKENLWEIIDQLEEAMRIV